MLLIKRHWVALAALAALSACGGGADPEATAVTPQAAADALRMRAQAIRASAVSANEAAEQLMNYAEAQFPIYFPGHKTTADFAPFRFRYYPETGIYLGVVVTGGTQYTLNGVYVMGGAFGAAPLYVGLLTQFITPVDPGPGPSGSNNGCYDLALFETQGTHVVISNEYTGTVGGTQTTDTLVGALTTFEGHQARESVTKSTGTNTVQGITTPVDVEAKSYALRTGDAEVTYYGVTSVSKMSIGGISFDTNSKTVWNPPWVDKHYALKIGESMTVNQVGIVTTTGAFGSSTTPLNLTQTTKYVGQETITVPAGTYNTCKFEDHDTASPNSVTTQWVIVGKGLPAQIVSKDGATTTQTIKATSITINGQRI